VVQRVRHGLLRDPSVLLAPLADRMAALAAEDRYEEAADMRDSAAALATALRRQHRFDALRRAGRLVIELPGAGGVEVDAGLLVAAWDRDGRATLGLDGAPTSAATGEPGDPERAGAVGVGADRAERGEPDPAPRSRSWPPPRSWATGEPAPPGAAPAGGRCRPNGDRATDLAPRLFGDEALPAPDRDTADELLCIVAWLDRYGDRVRLVEAESALWSPWPALPSFVPRPSPMGGR
jgi:hypothetical protein